MGPNKIRKTNLLTFQVKKEKNVKETAVQAACVRKRGHTKVVPRTYRLSAIKRYMLSTKFTRIETKSIPKHIKRAASNKYEPLAPSLHTGEEPQGPGNATPWSR